MSKPPDWAAEWRRAGRELSQHQLAAGPSKALSLSCSGAVVGWAPRCGGAWYNTYAVRSMRCNARLSPDPVGIPRALRDTPSPHQRPPLFPFFSSFVFPSSSPVANLGSCKARALCGALPAEMAPSPAGPPELLLHHAILALASQALKRILPTAPLSALTFRHPPLSISC